jgi:hypothetical protein
MTVAVILQPNVTTRYNNTQPLRLLGFHANIQNITASKYHITIVSCRRVAAILSRSFQNYVHVTIGIYHSTSVLDVVLQSNAHLSVEFLDQQVERLPGGLQSDHISWASFVQPLNKLAIILRCALTI